MYFIQCYNIIPAVGAAVGLQVGLVGECEGAAVGFVGATVWYGSTCSNYFIVCMYGWMNCDLTSWWCGGVGQTGGGSGGGILPGRAVGALGRPDEDGLCGVEEGADFHRRQHPAVHPEVLDCPVEITIRGRVTSSQIVVGSGNRIGVWLRCC